MFIHLINLFSNSKALNHATQKLTKMVIRFYIDRLVTKDCFELDFPVLTSMYMNLEPENLFDRG